MLNISEGLKNLQYQIGNYISSRGSDIFSRGLSFHHCSKSSGAFKFVFTACKAEREIRNFEENFSFVLKTIFGHKTNEYVFAKT